MSQAKHLHRFQRLCLERPSLNASKTKQEDRERIQRETEEFFARGGRKTELPQNAHGINVSNLSVEEVHHLHVGKGPGRGNARSG